MNTTIATQSDAAQPTWLIRMRYAVAIAVVWAGFHYIVDGLLWTRTPDAPFIASLPPGGILPMIGILVVVALGSWLSGLITGRFDGERGVLVVGIAVALWVLPAGTIDAWLIRAQADPTATPSAVPYLLLLIEYLFWIAVLVLAYFGGAGFRADLLTNQDARRELGLDHAQEGLVTLLLLTAASAVLISILVGPRLDQTYRLQVYFAIVVGTLLGVIIVRRLARAEGLLWYGLAPLAIGVLGVLVAAWRPALPGQYAAINILPAWGLVRPLPVEMVAVGVVTIIATLRARRGVSSS